MRKEIVSSMKFNRRSILDILILSFNDLSTALKTTHDSEYECNYLDVTLELLITEDKLTYAANQTPLLQVIGFPTWNQNSQLKLKITLFIQKL